MTLRKVNQYQKLKQNTNYYPQSLSLFHSQDEVTNLKQNNNPNYGVISLKETVLINLFRVI